MSGRMAVVGVLEAGPRYLVRRALDCLSTADLAIIDADWDRRGLVALPGAAIVPVSGAAEAVAVAREEMDRGLAVVRVVPQSRWGETLVAEARPLARGGYPVEAVPTLPPHAVALARLLQEPKTAARWPGPVDGKAAVAVAAPDIRRLVAHLTRTLPADELVQWASAGGESISAPVALGRLDPNRLPTSGEWWVLVGQDHVVRRQGDGLLGRRVLILRAEHQASHLRLAVEDAGGLCLEAPILDIAAPDWGAVDGLLTGLDRYQWVVFTSTNGVGAFFDRLRFLRRDVRTLTGQIAAVGAETAARLRDLCLEPALVPAEAESRQEGLLAAFGRQGSMRGQSVLLVTGDRRSPRLAQGLRQLGAVVDEAVVYRTRPVTLPPWVDVEVRRGGIDAVAFTSGSTARFLCEQLSDEAQERLRACRLVAIGPATRGTLEELGLPVAAEAASPSIEALVDALGAAFAEAGS